MVVARGAARGAAGARAVVPTVSAVPFTFKRSQDLGTSWKYESKTGTYEFNRKETAHGLVRLEADRLVIQWRLAVRRQLMSDASYETREDIEPVREIVIPLAKVAGAFVPERRWWHWTGPKLVITASDLLAFEKIAGQEGLRLEHPSKLVLRIKAADRLIAREFAAELALNVAQLPAGDGDTAASRLPPGSAIV